MMICVVSIEGVLAQGHDLKIAQPTKWARSLYDALHTQYRMIAFTEAEHEIADWWLRREMLRDWAAVMTKEPYLAMAPWKIRQIEDFLSEGWEVGMVIDVDVNVLQRVAELGVLTLQVSHPIIRVGWKPHEVTPRPWVEVADTLE